MGAFLCGTSSQSKPSNTPENRTFVGRQNGNTVESNRTTKFTVGGTLSLLAVYVDNSGSNRTIITRKCATYAGTYTNGNLTPTITNTTAGVYRDTTHSDTITAGEFWSTQMTCQVNTATWYWMVNKFVATTGHVGLYGAAGFVTLPGSTKYLPIDGQAASSATESSANVTIRTAGSHSGMALNLNSNTSDGTTVVTSRKNTAAGNMTFTVAAGTGAGYFEESAPSSDSVSSGDLICIEVLLNGSTGAVSISNNSSAITATSGSASDMYIWGNQARAAGGTVNYLPPVGCILNLTSTSETERRVQPGFACTISKFRIKCSANTYGSNATVVMRKNGVDVITLTLTAGSTTLIEDASTTMTMTDTDDYSISIVGGGSGSATVAYMAYVLDSGATTIPVFMNQYRQRRN